MTLKSRLAGFVTVLVLFAMVPSLFAQVSVSIIPDVDSGDINTNRNAAAFTPGTAGSGILVVGSLLATSTLNSTILRLTFPGPITSSPANPGGVNCTLGFSSSSGAPGLNFTNGNSGTNTCGPTNGVPSADPIKIIGASGVFAAVSNPLLNTGKNAIEIYLPSNNLGNNTSSGSFRLTGVRFDVNGLSGAQTVTASLNTSINNYVLGTPSSGTVISNLAAGISSLSIGVASGSSTTPGTGSLLTSGSIGKSSGAFVISEGCASCWRTATENSDTSGTATDNSTQIRLTFNNIPTGVTLTLSATTGSDTKLTTSLSVSSIAASSNTTVIDFTKTDLTKAQTLEIDYTINALTTSAAAAVKSATLPITVTATMFPIGTGLDTNGDPTEASGYPTFSDTEVPTTPLTIVNLVPAATYMLMPLVETVGTGFPYDTGLSIANTTADPFGGAGAGGATPGSGTITLNFYPINATGATSFTAAPLTVTTSATNRPGQGLSSDGTLAPGSTWIVLLSQVLALAGQPAGQSFEGYAFIQANFLDAHGVAFISDFKSFSGGASVLVLPPPSTTPRGSSGFEGLHF